MNVSWRRVTITPGLLIHWATTRGFSATRVTERVLVHSRAGLLVRSIGAVQFEVLVELLSQRRKLLLALLILLT